MLPFFTCSKDLDMEQNMQVTINGKLEEVQADTVLEVLKYTLNGNVLDRLYYFENSLLSDSTDEVDKEFRKKINSLDTKLRINLIWDSLREKEFK